MKRENQFQFTNSSRCEHIIALNAVMSDFSYVRHAHEEYSLGVTLQGRQDFFCQNAFYRSPVGGVMVFDPEDVHDGHSGGSDHLEYVMLYIHPDTFKPLFQALGCSSDSPLRLQRPLFTAPALRRQILHLSALMRQPDSSRMEYESVVFQIAQSLVAFSGKLDIGSPVHKRTDTLLIHAKDYILAHLDQDISIDDIAGVASMSKFHFIRSFRQQFGITPHQYVLNCRVNLARKLIASGQSLTSAAYAAGFADHSHLNRYFKRVYGMAPKYFQRQLVD
ncbi:helix-turn-helix domain-containing protein [Celerinatantimonas sp. YJH-8]|uniref:helix-turn-helix domain-containing protein n=1 Tax=Celerinatantimonas sp. YJH-8 TaxID=3228714 RepID=UPI0038C88EAE